VSTRSEAAKSERKIGDYEVLSKLKAGGMGEVLLARKRGARGFERLVALKTIRSDLRGFEQLRSMFLDEARLLSRLHHPVIAQVYDFGEDDDTLFLAMEYVAGVQFRDLYGLRPPPGVVARAMAEVCRGLHAVHELTDLRGNSMNVVHRDVSPENLMLTFDGRVKVLDFGIAMMRGREAPVTEFGAIKGKPPYLAPEQIKNEPVDRRTDVFAASIVLHELLTGERLFDGDSVYAIARMIEDEPLEPPSAKVDGLPVELDELVMQGLQRDPDERFSNAQAMANALDRVATRVDAESLEAYARRALADPKKAHRQRLQRLLEPSGTQYVPPTASRPTGVMTAQADGQSELVAEPIFEPRLETPVAEKMTTPLSDRALRAQEAIATTDAAIEAVGGGNRGSLIAILLAVAAAAAIALWFGLRSDDSEVAVLPAHDAMAAVETPTDASVAVESVSDAAVAVASAVLDAEPPKKVAGGRPVRERPRDRPPRHGPPDAGTAKPTPTVTEFGRITVAAEPFALVKIDGNDVGTTPVFRRKLAVGVHEVVLVSPDSGAIRLRRQVTITAGKLEKVILK
jgi:serine/threonine-protein kinase